MLASKFNACSYALEGSFKRLRSYAADARPGVAFGLARDHRVPGDDWCAWANARRTELVALAAEVPAETAAAAKSTKSAAVTKRMKAKDPAADTVTPDDVVERALPDDWLGWPATRDKTAVLFGGEPREDRREILERAFEFAELDWVPSRLPRKCDALVHRVSQGKVDLILILRAFSAHRDYDKIVAACDQAGVRWAVIDMGYGIQQVRIGIERALGSQQALSA